MIMASLGHRTSGHSRSQSHEPVNRDLFRSACAPELARMMIDLVDEDEAASTRAKAKLLESVTTKHDYATAFLKMFSEDQIPGISEIFAAARRFIKG